MEQLPPHLANPHIKSVSGEIKQSIEPSRGFIETSPTNVESNTTSISTPLESDAGSVGVETEQSKKKNKSFKITGILPSRAPSNSDDDDADDSKDLEEDVPDTAQIQQHVTRGKSPIGNTLPIQLDVGNLEPITLKPTATANSAEPITKIAQPRNLNGDSSSSTKPMTAIPGTPAMPSAVGQKRNSHQGGIGNAAGGSNLPPSLRTGMALGYRFNIFVYDHKVGSSFDPHRTPASQVRATAASIFVQSKEGVSNDSGTKSKTENPESKEQKSGELSSNESTPNDLPFLQAPGEGMRPCDFLYEAEPKSTNVPNTTKLSNCTTGISGGNHANEKSDKHGPQDRFKVVRVETVVAKEIGRWTLVDYANRSAPVMPSNPACFPPHISPTISLTSGGKQRLKSNSNNSVPKQSDTTMQNTPAPEPTQPGNIKHIPEALNQPSKGSCTPHQDNMCNPTTSFQNNQQVHDVHLGVDQCILHQSTASHANNMQHLDITTANYESIAYPPQLQHNVERQSKSPVPCGENINQAVQNTTNQPQQQTMQQANSHLTSQQLPKSHTTFNSIPISPTYGKTVFPLPPEQASVINDIDQSLANTGNDSQSQTLGTEQINHNIPEIEGSLSISAQTMCLDQTQEPTHGSVLQTAPINFNGAASHNEEFIQTNYQQATSIPSQYRPQAEESTTTEYKLTNIAGQSIGQLERNCLTLENGEVSVGDCVDIESLSVSNKEPIDNRIGQAMDLVKNHLISAVLGEVDDLKAKMARMAETIVLLQGENQFLRSNVPIHVLGQLPSTPRLLPTHQRQENYEPVHPYAAVHQSMERSQPYTLTNAYAEFVDPNTIVTSTIPTLMNASNFKTSSTN